MTEQTQVRKIKCPHCGWIRTIDVRVVEDESMATVVRASISEALGAAAERIKALLADPPLKEANAWVDMPKCPHCQNVYRYNVQSGEVTK